MLNICNRSNIPSELVYMLHDGTSWNFLKADTVEIYYSILKKDYIWLINKIKHINIEEIFEIKKLRKYLKNNCAIMQKIEKWDWKRTS